MKIIVSIIFYLIATSIFCQKINGDAWYGFYKNDREQELFKGKVKTSTETVFKIDSANGEKMEVLSYPRHNAKSGFEFDKDGEIIKFSTHYENYTGHGNYIFQLFEELYEYSDGKLKQIHFNKWGKKGITKVKYLDSTSQELYSNYNENGLLIDKQIHTDDINGNSSKREDLDSLDNVLLTIIQEYDQYKREIKEIWMDDDTIITLYEYDSSNLTRKITSTSKYFHNGIETRDENFNTTFDSSFSNDGKMWYSIRSKYNCQNDVIEEIYNSDSDKENYKYEYKYDKFNNWIEQKIYLNGRLTHIVNRKITYFN